jgi:hypothetical protein
MTAQEERLADRLVNEVAIKLPTRTPTKEHAQMHEGEKTVEIEETDDGGSVVIVKSSDYEIELAKDTSSGYTSSFMAVR